MNSKTPCCQEGNQDWLPELPLLQQCLGTGPGLSPAQAPSHGANTEQSPSLCKELSTGYTSTRAPPNPLTSSHCQYNDSFRLGKKTKTVKAC